MKKLIVSNWKNYVATTAQAEEILERVNDFLESLGETLEHGSTGQPKELSMVFCPPFTFIKEVGNILMTSHFEHQAVLGAQDLPEDVAENFKKMNVRYVIVGHSDRRYGLGESDEMVNKKLKDVLRNEMIPIVCIGERVRDENYKKFLEQQIAGTFADLSADEITKCIIAYEPVWAISTNPDAKPDTPESALESIKIIRNVLIGDKRLAISDLPMFLYGGSVTSHNVGDFLQHDEISGVLVGGASVDKEEFVKILSIVKQSNENN